MLENIKKMIDNKHFISYYNSSYDFESTIRNVR